eukprot:TRINITY_DN6078_c0_g1_i2.p1 TRINITY_DN6078_c0_g1~~TRINITY_DN6078_c0_g1_i2.p1  ORF type:complete len:457 (-),score=50.43 TRINITY_DN6078_c0_g1_i2:26-1396(-)
MKDPTESSKRKSGTAPTETKKAKTAATALVAGTAPPPDPVPPDSGTFAPDETPYKPPPPKDPYNWIRVGNFPQPGILPSMEQNTAYVIVRLADDCDEKDVRNALAAIPSLGIDKVLEKFSLMTFAEYTANRYQTTQLFCNIGFSPALWRKWNPKKTLPKQLREFTEMVSEDKLHSFPATGGDIMVHIKSPRSDLIVSIVEYFRERLGPKAFSDYEVHYCWNSLDGRNQFGFFDAASLGAVTANPVLNVGRLQYAFPFHKDFKPWFADLGRIASTFIGKEDPENENGTYGLSQLYIHDLAAWNRLTVTEQEFVFGKKKDTGLFIYDPNTSAKEIPETHIVRTHFALLPSGEIDPNFPEISNIPAVTYRQSASFSKPDGTRGLFFLQYGRDMRIFNWQLERMIGKRLVYAGLPHTVDRLLHYTKAKTGQYWYFPNLFQLVSLTDTVTHNDFNLPIIHP